MKKIKGNIAEAAAILELSMLGLPVFKELGDSSSVDLITLVDKKPITIQVKYAEIDAAGAVSLNLRKTGPGGYVYYYTLQDFDLFALYVNDTKDVLWIATSEALSKHSTTISFRYMTSAKTKTNRMAVDYKDFYKAVSMLA